jgi:hypothetical protein
MGVGTYIVIALVVIITAIIVGYCCYRRYMRRKGGRGLRLEEIPSDDATAPLASFQQEEQGPVKLPSLLGPKARAQGSMPTSETAPLFAETEE